jgi:amidophosphoribosyltransferase
VIIDDSIVRGTTLQMSILKILDRLGPKKIVVVSSAPQIRYPDCYGIDMARLEDLIAFRAMLALLKKNNKTSQLKTVYKKAKAAMNQKAADIKNHVKPLYDQFTDEEISKQISFMLRTKNINAEIDVIFQSVANLHEACPKNKGDWYFTGNYPTDGGNKVVNQAYINFYEGNKDRAY